MNKSLLVVLIIWLPLFSSLQVKAQGTEKESYLSITVSEYTNYVHGSDGSTWSLDLDKNEIVGIEFDSYKTPKGWDFYQDSLYFADSLGLTLKDYSIIPHIHISKTYKFFNGKFTPTGRPKKSVPNLYHVDQVDGFLEVGSRKGVTKLMEEKGDFPAWLERLDSQFLDTVVSYCHYKDSINGVFSIHLICHHGYNDNSTQGEGQYYKVYIVFGDNNVKTLAFRRQIDEVYKSKEPIDGYTFYFILARHSNHPYYPIFQRDRLTIIGIKEN